MTRSEAYAIRDAILKLRNKAEDKDAAEVKAIYPKWRQGNDYQINDRVVYKDTLYRVITAHKSQPTWTPDVAVSLFAKILIPDDDKIYEWEQPDSTNPYKKGDKVTHNGKTWISTIDGNVWEPGVYGWEIVE